MSPSSISRPSRNLRWGVFVVLLFVLSSPVAVFARSYHVQRYNAGIVVGQDGRAIVTEELTFSFQGAYKGVYRQIPVEYPGPGGSNYTLFLESIDVADETGAP